MKELMNFRNKLFFQQVSLFDTVEDFWALYNHIQTASGLNWGSDYYLFKEVENDARHFTDSLRESFRESSRCGRMRAT